jgi:hypothetical protein
MRIRSRPAWAGGVLGLLLLVGGPAPLLGATATQKCTGAKAKAFGSAVAPNPVPGERAQGVAIGSLCVAKAEAKLLLRFAKADQAGGCRSMAPRPDGSGLRAGIRATTGDASCAARRSKPPAEAAGKALCARKAASGRRQGYGLSREGRASSPTRWRGRSERNLHGHLDEVKHWSTPVSRLTAPPACQGARASCATDVSDGLTAARTGFEDGTPPRPVLVRGRRERIRLRQGYLRPDGIAPIRRTSASAGSRGRPSAVTACSVSPP